VETVRFVFQCEYIQQVNYTKANIPTEHKLNWKSGRLFFSPLCADMDYFLPEGVLCVTLHSFIRFISRCTNRAF